MEESSLTKIFGWAMLPARAIRERAVGAADLPEYRMAVNCALLEAETFIRADVVIVADRVP